MSSGVSIKCEKTKWFEHETVKLSEIPLGAFARWDSLFLLRLGEVDQNGDILCRAWHGKEHGTLSSTVKSMHADSLVWRCLASVSLEIMDE